jgi:protein-tyrosine phosphatase
VHSVHQASAPSPVWPSSRSAVMADEGEWVDLGRTAAEPPARGARAAPAASDEPKDSAGSDGERSSASDAESSSEEEEEARWEASEIVPGVWVGRKEDAELPNGLAEHGIGLVISVHNEEQRTPVALAAEDPVGLAEGVEWCRLKIEDRADSDLLRHFDAAADKIAAFRRSTAADSGEPAGVLVHCLAGQSRSVAIVAAFLMRERRHSLRGLIEWDGSTQTHGDGLMQRARRGVFPNRGLWRQLVAYEAACLGAASYEEDQLPGSIAFDREAIEAIVSRFQRERSAGGGGGASKRSAGAPEGGAGAGGGKRRR